MLKREARELAGSLTVTSKMPAKSYSLPTAECPTGFKLSKVAGTICFSCYADRGFYKVYAKGIQKAQNKRLASIDHDSWVTAMLTLIGNDSYFRWHDSGDIQGMPHLQKLVAIAKAKPACTFWLPTRERGTVRAYLKFFGAFPKNLIVRLSAVKVDQKSQTFSGMLTSSVHSKLPAIGIICGAPENGGKCGECRHCWNPDIKNVSYKLH